MNELLLSLYFFLPAYMANMSPVIAKKLNLPLGLPISKKLFGSHKTLRGFYSGYFGALIILWIQKQIQSSHLLGENLILNYQDINLLFWAFLFSIGALTGDLLKSFFKRRLNKKEGTPWFPFDQIDFVIGAFIFIIPFLEIDFMTILIIIIITPILHFLTNIIAYLIGFKKVWW